jgi:DNA-binding transcriptional LysR family regulator
LALVASGLGVALVSAGMSILAPPHVAFRPLVQTVEAVGVAVAWNSERDNDLCREIVAIARRIADESGEDNAMVI